MFCMWGHQGTKYPVLPYSFPDTEETSRDAAFMCPVPAGKGWNTVGKAGLLHFLNLSGAGGWPPQSAAA